MDFFVITQSTLRKVRNVLYVMALSTKQILEGIGQFADRKKECNLYFFKIGKKKPT
jgi:hypothetical protein